MEQYNGWSDYQMKIKLIENEMQLQGRMEAVSCMEKKWLNENVRASTLKIINDGLTDENQRLRKKIKDFEDAAKVVMDHEKTTSIRNRELAKELLAAEKYADNRDYEYSKLVSDMVKLQTDRAAEKKKWMESKSALEDIIDSLRADLGHYDTIV